MIFVINKKIIIENKINLNKTILILKKLLKNYKNHLKITRALIIKRTTYSAFVILQNQSFDDDNKDHDDGKNYSHDDKLCLCEKIHSFRKCLYIITKIKVFD